MSYSDADHQPSGDEPRDEWELSVLDGLREIFEEIDPMPPDLPERICFALALRDLDVEVARLAADDKGLLAAVRGAEHTRTVTFDSDSLTIMIRIDANRDGTARVDGWLAPPQCREIEMTTAAGPLSVISDEQGRFAFGHVPRGTSQLTIRPAAPSPGGAQRCVVTPALVL